MTNIIKTYPKALAEIYVAIIDFFYLVSIGIWSRLFNNTN